MKKTLLTLLLVAASAFALMSSTSALAWNNWSPGGYGMRGGYGMMGGGYGMRGRGCAGINGSYGMMNYQGDTDNTSCQAFRQDTADTRASLAADMAEFNALMAGSNPDPARARSLSESISAKQNQLAEAARKNNIQAGGNGWYCNRW